MLARYEDIRAKIKERPKWYDDNGVPRYSAFSPELCPDIYADEVILLEISCQDCGRRFLVEMSWSIHRKVMDRHSENFTNRIRMWLKKEKKDWCPIHYGDPPPHKCVGDTMNCSDLRIVEFWKRAKFDWKRLKKFEIELEEPN